MDGKMIRRGEHDGGVAKPPTTIIVYEDSGSQASADAGGLPGETAAPPAHRDWGEQQVSGDTIASFFSAATRAPMGWGGAEGKGDSGDLTAQTFSGDTLASLFGSSSTQHEGAGGPGRGDIFEAFNPLGWFGPREQQAAAVQGGDGSGRLFEAEGVSLNVLSVRSEVDDGRADHLSDGGGELGEDTRGSIAHVVRSEDIRQ